jgi:hypothetical protein
MSGLFLENIDGRKLAHAYVALALAQDVAKRDVNEASRLLLFILEITAELLEEILQNALPEESPTDSLTMPCSDMLM